MAGFAILAVGILFFSTPDDRADHHFMLFGIGSLVWAVLGSLTVMAKLAQWRISKRALASAAGA
jgi:hypothetical protein